jgi:putative phosphoesterase
MIEDRVIHLDGIAVWLEHVRPPYGYIVPRENKMLSRHIGHEVIDTPRVVVSGHTHKAEIKNYRGVLLVNPGSATWPEYMARPGTVGLLEIDSGSVEARIVQL